MNTSTASILAILLIIVQIISSASAMSPAGSSNDQLEYAASYASKLDQLRPYRFWKRAHNIDTRALNQFKNCYFSPIQCVLMERRR